MNRCFIFYILVTAPYYHLTLGETDDIGRDTNQVRDYHFSIQQITTRWDLAKASGFGLTREEIRQHPLNELDANEVCEAAQNHARQNGIAARMQRAKTFEVYQYGIFRHNKMNSKDVFAGLRCPLVPLVVLRFADGFDEKNPTNRGLTIVIQDSIYMDQTYTFNAVTVESVKDISDTATRAPEAKSNLDQFPLDENQRWEACIAARHRIQPAYEVNLLPGDEWSEIPRMYDIDGKKNVVAFGCHSFPKMYLRLVEDENHTNDEFAVMVEKS